MFQGKQNSGIPLGFAILNCWNGLLFRAIIENKYINNRSTVLIRCCLLFFYPTNETDKQKILLMTFAQIEEIPDD